MASLRCGLAMSQKAADVVVARLRIASFQSLRRDVAANNLLVRQTVVATPGSMRQLYPTTRRDSNLFRSRQMLLALSLLALLCWFGCLLFLLISNYYLSCLLCLFVGFFLPLRVRRSMRSSLLADIAYCDFACCLVGCFGALACCIHLFAF